MFKYRYVYLFVSNMKLHCEYIATSAKSKCTLFVYRFHYGSDRYTLWVCP
jgi:hypothetical protein